MFMHFSLDPALARDLIFGVRPQSILCVEIDRETVEEFRKRKLEVCEATWLDLTKGSLPACDVGICSNSVNSLSPAEFRVSVQNLFSVVRNTIVVLYPTFDDVPLAAWAAAAKECGSSTPSLIFGKPESRRLDGTLLSQTELREANDKPSSVQAIQLDRMTEALEAAHRDVHDLAARNEILLSQLENLPHQSSWRSQALSDHLHTLEQRVDATDRAVQDIISSRIWRTLVWIGGLFSGFRHVEPRARPLRSGR